MGISKGFKHTEETKRKISESKMGHTYGFQKGNIPHNKGKKHSEETKLKMKLTRKGRKGLPCSEETKRKIGQGNKGKVCTEEHRRKIGVGNKGKIFTEEHRNKISLAQKGEKCHNFGKRGAETANWKGGLVTEYEQARNCYEAKEWRISVFDRDDYTCQVCGDNIGNNLNAHHMKSFIKYPEIRYDITNGITVCKKCHIILHSKKRFMQMLVRTGRYS